MAEILMKARKTKSERIIQAMNCLLRISCVTSVIEMHMAPIKKMTDSLKISRRLSHWFRKGLALRT